MFRRVFSSASKGLPLAAAAVAIGDMKVYSNEELIKKPKWYMTNILKLEETVKQLSRYQPIESASFLHDALDILKRYTLLCFNFTLLIILQNYSFIICTRSYSLQSR
jgi:hypothetical protein